MTFTQFLQGLHDAGMHFTVRSDGAIRLKDRVTACPMQALYHHLSGYAISTVGYSGAAQRLGLRHDTMLRVINAADHRDAAGRVAKDRAALLRACGL